MSKNKPISLNDLSDSFLTQILNQAGTISKSTVTGHEIVTHPEPGQTTEMAFIALSYDEAEAGAPSRLVAKIPTIDPDALAFCKYFEIYEREVGFFQKIGNEAGVSIPACYYGHCDDAGDNFLLLLEDLTGNITGDYVHTDIEMVESLIVTSAKMHSRWWGNESLDQYPWLDGKLHNQRMMDMCLPKIDTFLGKMSAHLNPYFIRIVEAIRSNPRALEDMNREPHTLIHGDLHINNAFFTHDKQPIFIDWQLVSFGNPSMDFIKPFFTAETSDQQRIPEILRRYLDALHAGGVTDYSFEQMERDALAGLLMVWAVEINALAETDVGIIAAFCESRDSSIEEVYGRIGDMGERFQLAEFIETF